MEDLFNARHLFRGYDEKDFSEPTVTVTVEHPAPNMAQVLSKKLLTWGVEARGEDFGL